jgi:hypothetical protein
MEVNWTVIGILAFCAIILVVYLIRRNRKDEKDVEKFFNEEKIIEKETDTDDEA